MDSLKITAILCLRKMLLFLRNKSIQKVVTKVTIKGIRTKVMDVMLSRIIHRFFEDFCHFAPHLINIYSIFSFMIQNNEGFALNEFTGHLNTNNEVIKYYVRYWVQFCEKINTRIFLYQKQWTSLRQSNTQSFEPNHRSKLQAPESTPSNHYQKSSSRVEEDEPVC